MYFFSYPPVHFLRLNMSPITHDQFKRKISNLKGFVFQVIRKYIF